MARTIDYAGVKEAAVPKGRAECHNNTRNMLEWVGSLIWQALKSIDGAA